MANTPHPSEFDNFSRDFYAVNWIDNPTWQHRKIYNNTPFLKVPGNKFNIKLGNLLPNFYCYLTVSAEQFGDTVAFPLNNFDIKFYLYDNNYNLILRSNAEVNNYSLGEIVYNWKSLDIEKEGVYTCELEFIDKNTKSSFRLPDTTNRIQIIVTK